MLAIHNFIDGDKSVDKVEIGLKRYKDERLEPRISLDVSLPAK